MSRSKFLEDRDDDLLDDEEEREAVEEDAEADEDYLENEETLEELHVDNGGRIRPRRRRADEEEIDLGDEE